MAKAKKKWKKPQILEQEFLEEEISEQAVNEMLDEIIKHIHMEEALEKEDILIENVDFSYN
jgi:hypothetical protein